MAAQGAILQNHNSELVTCERLHWARECMRISRPCTQPDSPARPAGIEELREKREALQAQVRDEELEKSKIQQDLQACARLRPRAQLGRRTCAADLASCAGRCSPSGCHTSTSRCSVRCAPHSALLLLAAAAPGTERMSNCCSGATQVSAREEYDKVIQARRRPAPGAAPPTRACRARPSPAAGAPATVPRACAQETESAYVKILESSQTLLAILKKESANIARKRQVAPHGEGLVR